MQSQILKVVTALFAFALVLAIAATLDTSSPYLPFAIAGALAFWVRSAQRKREWLAWLIALPLVTLALSFPKTADPVLWTAAFSGIAGLTSFLLLGLRAIWLEGERRSVIFAAILPALLLPAYVLSAQNMLIVAQAMHATTLDLYLYKFDGSLGFQPSFWAGSLLLGSPLLYWLCMIVYYSLPFAMGIAYAATVDVRHGRRSWRLVTLFVVAGLFGWAFYNLFPATGPRFIFGANFPHSVLPYATLRNLLAEPIAVSQAIPRNAIPSLHMTWVFLIWWNAKHLPRYARAIAATYMFLTALSAMGIGEHYWIDLVVAYPFALMVQSVCTALPIRDRTRWMATIGGAVLTIAWLFALRHPDAFFVSRALPWLAIVITLLAADALKRRLFKRMDEFGRLATDTLNRIEAVATD